MRKNIMSVETISDSQFYVEKIIELTNDFVSKSICEGMILTANKNQDNLFTTKVITYENNIYNSKHQPRPKSNFLTFNLDFNSLLTLTNEMYRIIGAKSIDPANIINYFQDDRVIVNFQMMGQWNFNIRDLTCEQLEMMKKSLNSIKEELLIKKKTR